MRILSHRGEVCGSQARFVCPSASSETNRLSACAHFSISFFPSLASCLRIRGDRSAFNILKLGLWHRERERETHTQCLWRILADVKPIFWFSGMINFVGRAKPARFVRDDVGDNSRIYIFHGLQEQGRVLVDWGAHLRLSAEPEEGTRRSISLDCDLSREKKSSRGRDAHCMK